jgi:hypothetical protein
VPHESVRPVVTRRWPTTIPSAPVWPRITRTHHSTPASPSASNPAPTARCAGPTGQRTRVTIWVDMRDLDDSIADAVRPMIEESMANMGRLLDEDY